MRRFSYLIAVLGLSAFAASAQPGPHHGHGRGGPPDLERLAVLLDLDAYQKTQVERIFTEQRDAMRATREQRVNSGERPTREEMQARREQSREELLTKLQTVLTEPQIAKWKVLTERPAGERRGHQGHRARNAG